MELNDKNNSDTGIPMYLNKNVGIINQNMIMYPLFVMSQIYYNECPN